ncbi:MAG: site-specific integrase [Actinomycetota bacterium]
MAAGIVKRHSRSCLSRDGGRCNCTPTYQAWVSVKRDGRHAKMRRTFRREAEAKGWRTDALAASNRGALLAVKRDTRTVAEALAEFVADMEAGIARPRGRARYKPASIRGYRQQLRRYFEPSWLGAMKVPDVRRANVQRFADELIAQGLAPGTINNVLDPMRAFYRRAFERDELAYNPTERIDLPDPGGGRPKRIAPASEAAAIIAALAVEDRPLWATAFYAGLRRGELQALRCCDVDLGASRLHVERSWDQMEGPIDPKSESSRRTVPLLAILRDYLDEHLLRARREGDELVFGRTATLPFAPMAVGKRAKRVWKEAGLEPITLHECRHTFASLLIDSGTNPKAVQQFMGHSKIQTTFDTYGHLFPGSHDEVRERMDAYLEAARQLAAPA